MPSALETYNCNSCHYQWIPFVLADFIKYAENNDIEKNEEQIEKSKKLLTIRLKALIARNLWNTSAYYEIANDLNDSYIKAIEEINSNTFKKEKLVYK